MARVRLEAVVAAVVAVAVAVDLVETRRNGVARWHRANGDKHPDNLHMFVGANIDRDRRLW